MSKQLLTVVIPARDEERTLQLLVEKVLNVSFPDDTKMELIIINDASRDNTKIIADELSRRHKNIYCLHNRKKLGKSQSVRKGIINSRGNVVTIQDADLEYDPRELAGMLSIMNARGLDVVYGNRFGKNNEVIYWRNYLGNRALSFVSNIFTYPRIRVWIPDMEVCHKMVRGDVARTLAKNIVSKSSFGLEPEITAKLSRYKVRGRHLRFGVLATTYKARTIEDGKKISALKDGTKALKEIVWFNIQR